jgi:hypothetical protein
MPTLSGRQGPTWTVLFQIADVTVRIIKEYGRSNKQLSGTRYQETQWSSKVYRMDQLTALTYRYVSCHLGVFRDAASPNNSRGR